MGWIGCLLDAWEGRHLRRCRHDHFATGGYCRHCYWCRHRRCCGDSNALES